MKEFIVMGAYMTTEYNSNCVCVMCDKTKDEGSVKNGKFVCKECIDGLAPNQTHTTSVAQHVAPFFAQPSNRLTVYPTKVNSRAGTFEY
jgi:hypothetical protein